MVKKYWKLLLTLIIIVVYIVIRFFPLIIKNSTHKPTITFEQNVLTVSVKDSSEELLKGVHANDKEDGNLTSSIRIESMSPFTDQNERTVTYVVFDSDDQVTKATRTIQYKDYVAPTFVLSDQLRGTTYSTSELIKKVRAKSCVDGDITSKITVMNMTYNANKVLNLKLSVTDSTNTTSYLNANYYIENNQSINIALKKYLVYLKQGENFDFRQNIKTVIEHTSKDSSLNQYVDIDIPKMDKPGIYEVNYTLTRSNGNTGITTMLVVVE